MLELMLAYIPTSLVVTMTFLGIVILQILCSDWLHKWLLKVPMGLQVICSLDLWVLTKTTDLDEKTTLMYCQKGFACVAFAGLLYLYMKALEVMCARSLKRVENK